MRADPAGDAPVPRAASLGRALRRTAGTFGRDGLSDRAAALTYYSILSIFPAMLVVVSLVGLSGRPVVGDLIASADDVAPGAVGELLAGSLEELRGGRAGAGAAALAGLAAAVWSASGYVGAFMRAAAVVHGVQEDGPLRRTVPLRLGVTLVALVLLSVSAVAVVVSGPLAREAGDLLGLGSQAVTAWNIAKWPALLPVVSFLFSLLYWAAPGAGSRFRWVTPGGVLAIALWLAASGLFALYVSGFSSYNRTYGSLAGIIVFLVWLWITNLAILLGAELNAELEPRGGGHAADAPETGPIPGDHGSHKAEHRE